MKACYSFVVGHFRGALLVDEDRSDDEVVVLLPGAMGTSDSLATLIEALSDHCRVIAITYGSDSTLGSVCNAIAGVLNNEGIAKAHIMGQSYGGVIAQCFARLHPERTESLILSHTFVLESAHAWRFRVGLRLWRRIPGRWMLALLRRRLERVLVDPLRAVGHPDTQRWSAFIDRTMTTPRILDSFERQQHVLLDVAERGILSSPLDAALARRVMIVQSDNDPIIRAPEREALVAAYPGAVVRSFAGTGHITAYLRAAELARAVAGFVGRATD